MVQRGGGAILAMAGGREAIPDLGGSHVAWSALAGLCRQLAIELGPYGIRFAWLLSSGRRMNRQCAKGRGSDGRLAIEAPAQLSQR
jgi:3-oxoacyl-[acyl-carrier protein] reductase